MSFKIHVDLLPGPRILSKHLSSRREGDFVFLGLEFCALRYLEFLFLSLLSFSVIYLSFVSVSCLSSVVEDSPFVSSIVRLVKYSKPKLRTQNLINMSVFSKDNNMIFNSL